MLVEIILIAVFLATVAIGTSYFFAQTKVTMSSASQVAKCDTIAKQALENVVSLGARLYGYRMNDLDVLSYKPLFIKYDTGESNNIKHVSDGSDLPFPPEMYTTLYDKIGVSYSTQAPGSNTGVPLIGSNYPLEIGTSVLLVNFVNALQYLYNLDNTFFTGNGGKGKMYTFGNMNSGDNSGDEIFSTLVNYGNQFDLENMKLYIRVAPIDLTTEKVMSAPPPKILTRPRIHNPQNIQLFPELIMSRLSHRSVKFSYRN